MKIKPFIFESRTRYTDIADEIQDLMSMSLKEIKQKYLLNEINRGDNKVVYFTFTTGKFLLKVSSTSKEIEKEVEVYKCSGYSPLLTKIYGFDRVNFNWIVVEQIRTLTKDKFESLLADVLKRTKILTKLLQIVKVEKSSLEKEFIKLLKNKNEYISEIDNAWLLSLMELIELCNLQPGDLYHYNWGTRNGSDLVILDYGFEGFNYNEN